MDVFMISSDPSLALPRQNYDWTLSDLIFHQLYM
mgnify:CR=1 FL=1